MKRKIAVISTIAFMFYGCDGKSSSLTSPTNDQPIGPIEAPLRKANDSIVERLSLKKGSENPPPLSFGWISERLREIKLPESADNDKQTKYFNEKRGER